TTHAGPYPRGAFTTCPTPIGAIQTDGAGAGRVAERFSRLLARGEFAKARRFVDPSAQKLRFWSVSGRPGAISVIRVVPSRHDRLVRVGCGTPVASRSWDVHMNDGTPSASLDFTSYLVRRAHGWKVWAIY